jgi:hypothetical protein
VGKNKKKGKKTKRKRKKDKIKKKQIKKNMCGKLQYFPYIKLIYIYIYIYILCVCFVGIIFSFNKFIDVVNYSVIHGLYFLSFAIVG